MGVETCGYQTPLALEESTKGPRQKVGWEGPSCILGMREMVKRERRAISTKAECENK